MLVKNYQSYLHSTVSLWFQNLLQSLIIKCDNLFLLKHGELETFVTSLNFDWNKKKEKDICQFQVVENGWANGT